jgi:hypothetical protein
MLRDRIWGKGQLLVEKYDEHGRFDGFSIAENLFLTAGINELWKLFSAQSANAFDNGHAQIGIGDSNAAAAAGQTDLQAASNKTYVGMDATYPTAPSAGSIQYRATFGSSSANYAWQEFVLKHSTSAICLDRGVQSLGTKASGTTWVATLTLSLT